MTHLSYFLIRYEFWLEVHFLTYWCPVVPAMFVKYSTVSFKWHLQWSQTSVYHMSLGLFLDSSDFSLFSRSVVSNSLKPQGLQHARPPCPSPTPGAYSNSCLSCWWCHWIISSSGIPFSSHLQSFPASVSFPMSWFLASGGQSIGASASASILPMNIQDWFPLGWTGWISLLS